MGLQIFRRVFATALLTITAVQASPFVSSLNTRDLFVPSSTCNDIVFGAKDTVIGRVCVGILDGTLTVSYGPISPYTYSVVHVYVGTTAPTNRAPGSFPYSSNPGGVCTLGAGNATATCTIPVQPSWRTCDKKLFIATHASITSGTSSETAWGAGTCFGGGSGNCAKYWTFYTQCFCRSTSIVPPVTYTSTSVTTITSTSTTEYLTSTTSVTTYTVTSSSIIEFSTTSYDTITSTSSSILYSTSTPDPITTTVTCVNPYPA